MRVYVASGFGILERHALSIEGEWTNQWWHIPNSGPADAPGGAVAASGYGSEELRIYYKTGGRMVEIEAGIAL